MNWYQSRNGYLCFDENWIQQRNRIASTISYKLCQFAESVNDAWDFRKIETPVIVPDSSIDDEYNSDNYFQTTNKYGGEKLSLRPETPKGSYNYAEKALKSGQENLPLCIWQHGLSFRDEQNHSVNEMRLRQFYQLEFQCLYHESTYDDYSGKFKDKSFEITEKILDENVKMVEEDEDLPYYSEKTVDLEYKGLELCSMSDRKDYPDSEVENIEIAFGTDRLTYALEELK